MIQAGLVREERGAAKLLYTSIRIGFIIMWLVFMLFPIYWTLITAFKAPKAIYQGPYYLPGLDFTPSFVSWDWIFKENWASVSRAFLNSLTDALVSSFAALVLGGLTAYGLARYQYKFGFAKNRDLLFLIISQKMMPPIVAILGLYAIYQKLHLLDSTLGMILCYTWMNIPIAVFLLREYIASIPVEIEQAAAVDGYPRLSQFVRFTIPLIKPGLAAVFMLSFVFAWNESLAALILTFRKATTLPIIIAAMNGQEEPYWWIMSALGVLAMLPPAFAVAFLDRYLVRGLLLGGIRG